MIRKNVALIVFIGICMFASPASAIVILPHSEEMYEKNSCDRSGNIDIYFSAGDIFTINEIFTNGVSEYVLLRFTLSGTDIDPTITQPILCKDIQFDSDGDMVDPTPGSDFSDTDDFSFTSPTATWANVVSLSTIGSEVSDGVGDGSGLTVPANDRADIDAFVHGTAGNQYFEVVVYGLDASIIPDSLPASYSSDPTAWPKLSVGLQPTDPGIVIEDAESHAVCVNVSAFSYLSKLEASLDTWPNTLTYTPGDDQIGHFLTEIIATGCGNSDTAIEMCNTLSTPSQANCESCQSCFFARGDWTDEDLQIAIGANQNGVYLQAVSWENPSGPFSGSLSLYKDVSQTVPATGECSLEGKFAGGTIDASSLPTTASDNLKFCITYTLDPFVRVKKPFTFTAMGYNLPCGALFDETLSAVSNCGSGFYFPIKTKNNNVILIYTK